MRVTALVCLTAIAALMGSSGCVPGANDELKGAVEEALLPGMDPGSCEWGSSTYENEPKSWYGCWDYVSGDPAGVGDTVQSRLSSLGFEVSRDDADLTVELTGVRHSGTVCVDVLAPGVVSGRNTSPEEINPDPGEVFVDVWTAHLRDGATDPCAELPAWEA